MHMGMRSRDSQHTDLGGAQVLPPYSGAGCELGLGDPRNRRECLGPARIRLDCRQGHCKSRI